MSMTVELDVTAFVNALKKRGCSFYPSMLWVVSAAVNQREELRMGYNAQGEAGTWTFVSPYYAHFHKEDERFVKLVTVYSPCFETFYQRFCEDKRRFATYRGFEQTEIPPNTFDVSCLPWTHYRSFDMHVFDKGTYLAPVITWGRYLEKEGRLMLPLSLNLHHAAGGWLPSLPIFFRCGDMDAGFELKKKTTPGETGVVCFMDSVTSPDGRYG